MRHSVQYVNLSVVTTLRHSSLVPDRASQRIWWFILVFALLGGGVIMASPSEGVWF